MGKEFVNQHIVPKRYLDRFATQIEGKSIIGTIVYIQDKPKLFKDSTSNVWNVPMLLIDIVMRRSA